MKKLIKRIYQTFLVFNIALLEIFPVPAFASEPDSTVQAIYNKCDAVANDLNRQVQSLNQLSSNDSLMTLPIGLVKKIGQNTYIIAIDSMVFTPQGATFDAYMAIQFPNSPDRLAFRANNIGFNPNGLTSTELSRLELAQDFTINLGQKVRLFLPANGQNYVSWDCNGFNKVKFAGEFRFDKTLIEPDSTAGVGDSVVRASFNIEVEDLSNILVETSISPFRIKGLDDFGFSVQNAVVDLSDNQNSASMVFPPNYQTVYGSELTLWRGFYLKNLKVKLPEELSKKGQGRVELNITNLLIDDAGVSGGFSAENVFSTEEGDLGGWGFSITHVGVNIVANNFTGGELAGQVKIPAFDQGAIGYSAVISKPVGQNEVDYAFTLSTAGNLEMPCFFGSVTINNSSLLVAKQNGVVTVGARLNGNISIGSNDVAVANIGFQEFVIDNHAPYVHNGIFTLSSPAGADNKLANFPIVLESLTLGINNNKPILAFQLRFNVGDPNATNNFSLAAGFSLRAKIEEVVRNDAYGQPYNEQEWSLDQFQVNTIEFNIQTQPFGLVGAVNFYNDDPIYGNGFKGNLELVLKCLGNATIFARAQFGCTTFRYWNVAVGVPTHLPLGSSGAIINTIYGGLSYHMRMGIANEELINLVETSTSVIAAINSMDFIPDENIGISLRAGVGFEYLKKEILQGDLMFSITFNSNGGLNNISLLGKVLALKDPSDANSKSMLQGNIAIYYDHVGQIFDAQISITLNVADILIGNAWLRIYASPQEWYVHIGTPSNPCGLSIVNFASITAYFMFGMNLPPMPPLPPNLAAMFPNYNMNNSRNTGLLTSGDGFALGAALNISLGGHLGSDDWNVFGYINAGAGFDVMVYKFGPNVVCQENGKRVGIDGWYMQGQIYAYCGVQIGATIFGFELVLVEANAAMLLAGRFVDPTYVYGGVHLDVTLLGFITFDVTVDFNAGDECAIVGN